MAHLGKAIVGTIITTLSLVGCASSPTIPMSGKTTASPTLQNDTISLLSIFFQAKAKCSKIETIVTEVILVGSDLRGNQAGAVTHGVIKERWTATGRGQSVPLNVEFIPDGKGGTFFRIKP